MDDETGRIPRTDAAVESAPDPHPSVETARETAQNGAGEEAVMLDLFRSSGDATGGVDIAEPQPGGGADASASSRALEVKVSSIASYVPPRVETAAELAPRIGTSEDWIVTRTGVRERRISEEPMEVLGARAARAALRPGEVPDLILNASVSMRQALPDTSVYIQRELGLEGIPSFSVHASCLSFLAALQTAAALLAAGAYRRVLVVSAERGTIARNPAEPESAALLGDGAAAAVLEPTPKGEASEILGWRMCTWPRGAALTEVRGYGQTHAPNDPQTRPEHNFFSMDGPAVFKMALRHLPTLVRDLLADHGLMPADVDWVVPHQASGPGLALLPRLGFPAERFVNIVGQYGNCVAASIPMALAHLAGTGRLRRGQTVLLLGTGAGFSVGGAVLRW
jgi:3-oxoacyl-[acyl-carrier-protein] synthase-3